MEPLRFAIIGGGRWAEAHAQALRVEEQTLVGALVATAESKERLERSWAGRATTSLSELFSWDVDAVIIASPNHLHRDHALAALEANKHVLVEKPMALTFEHCLEMRRAAQAHQRVLAVGLEMRLFTWLEPLRALVASGELGRIVHAEVGLWRKPHRAGAGGWRSDLTQRGPPALEEPIHYLDLVRWLLSPAEARTVTAFSASATGREALQENLDVVLELDGGATALITRSLAAFGHNLHVRLVGERGTLEAKWQGAADADPQPVVAGVLQLATGRRELSLPQHSGHAFDLHRQTAAFVERIHGGGGGALATATDGAQAVALCLAVERSLQEHARVPAPQP